MVIAHQGSYAVCIKATSNITLYLNDPDRMAGAVHYRAGETVFRSDTIVEPDNVFAVDHRKLTDRSRILGPLPSDFHERLATAIRSSVMLSRERQAGLLRLLGEE